MVHADYFDGRQARAQPVHIAMVDGGLELFDDLGKVLRRIARHDIQWPERQRHGPRVAHFHSGGMVHCNDHAAWDAMSQASGHRESIVVRMQQNWRATAAACLVLIALAAATYLWGLPWASRGLVRLTPISIDREIGKVVLSSIESRWLKPSALPAAEQQRLRQAFARAVDKAYAGAERPAYDLRFHQSTIGPNAFALPGGTIILTDELVKLVDAREDVLLGVLGHELGHVRLRHGMRMLVQFTILNTATGIALGDFSSVAAAAPAVLAQRAYSRDHERESDEASLDVLRAAGHSPEAMVLLFEKLNGFRESRNKGEKKARPFDLGIALSSHPADAERIRFFREAAAHPR